MGFETLYFFLSIALLLGSSFLVGSMLLYRLTRKSVLGETINQKHPAYSSMRKFSSNFSMALTGMVALLFIANIYFSVRRLMEIGTQDARLVLLLAPLISIVLFLAVFVDMRKKLMNGAKGTGSKK